MFYGLSDLQIYRAVSHIEQMVFQQTENPLNFFPLMK